ncbi:MAG: hypothetical protein IKO89_08900 [Bacteroidales bacterium]|nr:hypothetical protein [Bacteroidales bacterium]MBR4488661.1 hypothetical protein [Bacteroidales bacterium]
MMATVVNQPFNRAQIEILNAMASLKSEEGLRELQQAISNFFAERADSEMERLWEEGVINEEVIEGWKNEHMRTPYHQ